MTTFIADELEQEEEKEERLRSKEAEAEEEGEQGNDSTSHRSSMEQEQRMTSQGGGIEQELQLLVSALAGSFASVNEKFMDEQLRAAKAVLEEHNLRLMEALGRPLNSSLVESFNDGSFSVALNPGQSSSVVSRMSPQASRSVHSLDSPDSNPISTGLGTRTCRSITNSYSILEAKEARRQRGLYARLQRKLLQRRVSSCSFIQSIVESNLFVGIMIILIFAQALFVGFSTSLYMDQSVTAFQELGMTGRRETRPPFWLGAVDVGFTVAFTVELLLRMMAQGFAFWCGHEFRWNFMDFFLVLVGLAELTMQAISARISFVRMLRLLRIVRTIRVLRMFRFFRQLRLLLFAVLNSILPLAWTLVFLSLTLFVFVIISLQAAADFISSAPEGDGSAAKLIKFFGGVWTAALTHFAAISGGLNWFEIVELLGHCGQVFACVFVLYVVLMTLMVLNIITGFFVTDALEITKSTREFASKAESLRRRALFQELRHLFEEIDVQGTGVITPAQFAAAVNRLEVRNIFAALEMEVSDTDHIFQLLDTDRSGGLEIDEFVMGCMSLKGPARALDMMLFMTENKHVMRHHGKALTKVQAKLERILHALKANSTLGERPPSLNGAVSLIQL